MAITRATPLADRRRRRARCRRLAAGGLVAPWLLAVQLDAAAQSVWRFTPTVTADVTFTNNVNLSPQDTRESDAIFLVSPGFTVDYRGSRASLNASAHIRF